MRMRHPLGDASFFREMNHRTTENAILWIEGKVGKSFESILDDMAAP